MPGRASHVSRPRASTHNSTVDRAFDLLFLFDEHHPVRAASELSELLHMPRSTTYRYLQTLRAYGLVEEHDARRFRLGARVLQLARVARAGMDLPEIALPVMREVGAKTGEVVLLTKRSGSTVVCVERVESSHPVHLSYERGQVLPVHAGASAKVLLAFADAADVDAVLASTRLERLTARTVTSVKVLRRQLAEIREHGFAQSEGEVDDGVRGVAAPIFGPGGELVAGLSVAGPAFRLDDARLPALVRTVRQGAEAISKRLQALEG